MSPTAWGSRGAGGKSSDRLNSPIRRRIARSDEPERRAFLSELAVNQPAVRRPGGLHDRFRERRVRVDDPGDL